MKRTVILFLLVLLVGVVNAQDRAIRKTYHKYNHIDGITTLTIPRFVIRFAAFIGPGENPEWDVIRNIHKIKILAVENEYWNKHINLYDEVMKNWNIAEYEPLVTVNEKDQNVVLLAKMKGQNISEFVVLVGGDDNALIYIKGDIPFSSLQELTGNIDFIPGLVI